MQLPAVPIPAGSGVAAIAAHPGAQAARYVFAGGRFPDAAPGLPGCAALGDLSDDELRRQRERARRADFFGALMSASILIAEQREEDPNPRRTPTGNQTGGFDNFKNSYIENLWGVDVRGTWTEGNDIRATNFPDPLLGAALFVSDTFTNVEAEVTLKTDVPDARVLARFDESLPGAPTGYSVADDGAQLTLYAYDGIGGESAISVDLGGVGVGDSFGIRCQGSNISILRNGVAVKTVVDTTWTSGRIGLAAIAATRFDYYYWNPL